MYSLVTYSTTPVVQSDLGFGKHKKRHCKHGVAKSGKRKGQCLKHKRSK